MKKKVLLLTVILSLSVFVLSSCTEKKEGRKPESNPVDEQISSAEETISSSSDDGALTESGEMDFRAESKAAGYYISEYVGDAQIVNIPQTVEGQEIMGIGANVFLGKNVQILNIPSTIKEISNGAVRSAEKLRKVTLFEGIEIIGYEAFCYCSSLREINFPGSLKVIEERAFADTGLTAVSFPEGLERLGQGAFAGTAISEVTIPAGILFIPAHAFEYCDSLRDVYIMNDDCEIDSIAFVESPNIVLHAGANSAVQQFAEESNIPFVAE